MKHIRNICIITCLILGAMGSQAQLPSLQDKLAGKDRVEEIMEIVDAHYAEIDSGIRVKTDERNYKHWARWGLYMSSRTDDQGRLVNVDERIRQAYHQYTPTSRSNTGNWVSRGPASISGTHGSAVGIGRVDRIAFHPTDANILYIGSPSGGLFKSINDGLTWSAITDNIPSTAISGIVVSHVNPGTVYILTGDGDTSSDGFVGSSGYLRPSAGVFVSFDAGINWFATAPLPIEGSYAGYQLIMDPNDANILLAATDQGIYRTSNGGNSWTQVLPGLTYEIKFKPGSSSYVYATQSGDFLRSLNGGLEWEVITDFDYSLPQGRVALAVTEAAGDRVYIMSGSAYGTEYFGGVYISYDSGESFTRQCNTPNIVESWCDGYGGDNQSSYDLAIGVSHALSNRVIAAGITTWRSTNTGVTWINASAGRCEESESTGFVHADVHDIEYNPLNGHVYLCSDGGVIKSTNHGVDWVNLSDGITASQIYHMAGSLTDVDNMVIGLQDNGCKRRNANTSVWDQILGADGYDAIYNEGSSTEGYFSHNKKLSRFWNNGSDATEITPSSGYDYFPRVTSAIGNGALVLAGYADIYKSTNSGQTWTNVSASGYWDIERCPSNANRFYAAGGESAFATTGSMFRSADMGDTWTLISNSPGYPSANIRLTDIDVRPNVSGNVWITFGGFSANNKVFYSNDVGVTWSNMSGSLPNIPINAIQVDINNNVYIGTDLGVFYRGASMSDWVPFWHRLPVIPVTDLELYEANDFIRAATFGRGVWESETYSTCPASIALSGTLQGHRYYEVSGIMTCTSIIYGAQNTRIVLKSGDYITLGVGFETGFGNTVHAYTAPCGVADNED